MNLEGVLTKTLWREIGNDLRGKAWDWWKANEATIVGMTKAEMHEIAVALKAKNVYLAQMTILANLDPKDPDDRAVWNAIRHDTTRRLKAAAQRRVDIFRALETLGRVAAKAIGMAVLAAIGI